MSAVLKSLAAGRLCFSGTAAKGRVFFNETTVVNLTVKLHTDAGVKCENVCKTHTNAYFINISRQL